MRINEENYVAKAESVILKLSKQVNKQGKVVVRTERPPQGDNSNE